MRLLVRTTWFIVSAVLVLAALAASALAEEPAVKPAEPAAVARSDEFEDRPETLRPEHTRSSREEDRIRALALFAAARVAEQKQDYPLALRNYERAWRFDPDAVAALREIVPLAFNLDRQAEAIRYALIMAEHAPNDPLLLRRLAIHLTEQGETERALRLYEKALKLHRQSGDKPSASIVLLWMEMGRLYFLDQKFTEAAQAFNEVGKALASPKEYGLDPTMQKALLNKADLTYQLFGEAYLEAGRAGDALSAFEKAQAIKTDDALFLYNRARVEQKQKQPAQALARLDTYFNRHFSNQGTGPYELLAEVLDSLGQRDQLVPRLENLHAVDVNNMPLSFYLAQQYLAAGAVDKAEPIYAALVASRPQRPPLEALRALADIYRKQKNVEKLLGILGDFVDHGGWSSLGPAGKALEADTETSKAVVAEARRQLEAGAPSLGYGERTAAAMLAVELKDFDAANALFEAALKAENAKPAEALLAWGLELLTANQFADAAKVFQRGLDEKVLPADNPALYFYLAGALEMCGRTDEAIEIAKKGADLQKDSPRFASRVAWIEYHAKRYEAARKSYAELIERFDKLYEVTEARDVMHEARLVMSNLAILEGKSGESEEWIEQVLDEFPEDVGALNDLGYLWADSNKHLDRALDIIKIAVAKEPKNMAYRDSLGWVLFRQGKVDEAIAELKAATVGESPDGVILDHLAEAQWKANERDAALASWNRAIESFEKKSEKDKASQIREKIARAQQAAAAK